MIEGNAVLHYEADNGLNVSTCIRNIGNKRTIFCAVASFPIMGVYDVPHTHGISIGYNF